MASILDPTWDAAQDRPPCRPVSSEDPGGDYFEGETSV
jgi:hypothetical protein